MNAGANGVETAARVVEVYALDRKGQCHTLSLADMHYSYRHCAVPEDFIFTAALLEGKPGNKGDIRAAMDEVALHRESVQPVREKQEAQLFEILKIFLRGVLLMKQGAVVYRLVALK